MSTTQYAWGEEEAAGIPYVEVKLTKGSLQIKIKNNEAIMIGPAEISYQGYIEI